VFPSDSLNSLRSERGCDLYLLNNQEFEQ
jgi:hypothetical protein